MGVELRECLSHSVMYIGCPLFCMEGCCRMGTLMCVSIMIAQASFLLMSGTLGENDELYDAIERHTGRPLRLVQSQERERTFRVHQMGETQREKSFCRQSRLFADNHSNPQVLTETGFCHLVSPFWRPPKRPHPDQENVHQSLQAIMLEL